jgi:hypothetical protein
MPHNECTFNPDMLAKCKDSNSISSAEFLMNEKGNCLPRGLCSKGFARHDDNIGANTERANIVRNRKA